MSAAKDWLNSLTDKNGCSLLPIIEDMHGRESTVLICSAAGDDPEAPLSAHLISMHGSRVAAGIKCLAEAAGCSDVILYAGTADMNGIAGLLSSYGSLAVTVVTGPSSPVLREPTALYSVLDTGVIRSGNAEHDYKRTFLSFGYQGRPTLAIDAETAYAACQLFEEPGAPVKKHIAVTNAETEIKEAALGTTLDKLIDDKIVIKPVLLGGVLGGYTTASELENVPLGFVHAHDSLRVLGDGDCVVTHTKRLYECIKELSCAKCVMCREGSWQLLAVFRDITEGKASRDDIALLEDICPLISAGSLCAFGQNMVSPALSAVTVCRDAVTEHIVGKSCAAGQCAGLLSYLIDPALCTGCGECLEACPEEAIEGDDGFIHMIDEKLCIKCGKCVPLCPENAIRFGEKIKVPKKLTKVGKFR